MVDEAVWFGLEVGRFRAGGVDRSKCEEASIARFAYAVSVDSFGAVAGQPR